MDWQLNYHEDQLRIKKEREALKNPAENPKEKPPSLPLRAQLLGILDDLPTSLSAAGQGFAHLSCPGGRNHYHVALNSPTLQDWLLVRALSRGLPIPNATQLRDAFRGLHARCHAGSLPHFQMNVRTAWNRSLRTPFEDDAGEGRVNCRQAIVLALDARAGRHAVVTPDGWSVESSPTPFSYHQVQQPIPEPTPTPESPEAALLPFRTLLRLDSPQHDAAWQTLLSWTLTALRPAKDAALYNYPILNLVGPHQSGKSVAAKLLALLLDPTGEPIHSLPSTERRLHGLAAAHHVLAFDDPGKINPEKSRHLSRLSSGIASLHPALQGMLVRPIILTTTTEKETKHLAHRVVDVTLPPLDNPLPQHQIAAQFEAMRPAILGALLTLLVRDFDGTQLLLPNHQTKKQKIEQSIPEFLATQGGEWSGTVTSLQSPLGFDVSTKAIGQYMQVTRNTDFISLSRCAIRHPVPESTLEVQSQPEAP